MSDEAQVPETPTPEVKQESGFNPDAILKLKFPVYLYEEGTELPEKGVYYLVTKTGIYCHKETKAGSALVPVKGIPWLEEPSVEFRCKLPKVPGRIIGQALTFFRKVFDKYHAEAYVTLLFSSKLNQYRLYCPKQKVSAASVNYDRTDQPSFEDRQANDWQMVGTIHSHCDFSAYHSGTDIGDEDTFDGIHITLGHVNRTQFSIACSIAINSIRESLEPEQACAGVNRISNREEKKSKWMSWNNDAFYFDLELTEAEAQGLVADTETIENDWMPKVEKESWGYSGQSFFGGSQYRTGIGFQSGSGSQSGSGNGIGSGLRDEDYGLNREADFWSQRGID